MLEETLKTGLAAMGLPAGGDVLSRFRAYYEALCAANAVMNLTAIEGEDETARLHFLDSAAALLPFPLAGKAVLDVGAGAGFPGLPMKLLCPELALTLLDSREKRVSFLNDVRARLGLDDVACVCARAEEWSEARRESFDCAVARAVARLNALSELCLPFVRPGGVFLALKGPAAFEELAEAEHAVAVLGGAVERVFEYELPGGEARHNIVIIRKAAPTPRNYPRSFAQIKKAPL